MDRDIAAILVSKDEIQQRVKQLGREISKDHTEQELVLIWILNGALLFTADLIRNITLPVRLDCIRVSSYQGTTKPVTEPVLEQKLSLNLEGQSILLVDDIFDTGKTLQKVIKKLNTFNPASIRTCVLLSKQTHRTVPEKPDYVGFEIPDQFVVGYGLDFAERYRHLPYIGVLKTELQNPPEWA